MPPDPDEMPLREFTDAKGATWWVWETQPTSSTVRSDYRGGWLTFESGQLRRRLAPIPEGWGEASEEQLRLLCLEAKADRLRTPLTPGSMLAIPRTLGDAPGAAGGP